MTDETRHTVSESADKIVLKAGVKRGTDTRDQDTVDVKIKGDDPAETAQRLHATVEAIREEGTAELLRATQPGGGGS